jgi:phenylalanyl-tRNA synthetase beta chain
VMLERGQPMHAFDDAKLRGAIGVRYTKAGEALKLLNDQDVEHRARLLAITDDRGPIALGGVMGGHATMVDDETTDVFFEAAYFDPAAVQGRARDLELASDAAYHYERGVDPGGTAAALERATALTMQVCGGKAGPVSYASGDLPRREPVTVRPARVRTLLGYPVEDGEIRAILERLQCRVESSTGGAMRATPPTWRFDLAIEEDYVEEVARVHGYEHVPAVAPRASVPMLALREGGRSRFDLRHAAAALGYQEVITYSFVSEAWERDFAGHTAPIRLANPIASHMAVMRTTLLPGLVQVLRGNLNRGESWVRIFEIGRCFEGAAADAAVQPEKIAGLAYGDRVPEQWGQGGGTLVDFFDLKGDVEALAGGLPLTFVAAAHPGCHPGRCATVRSGDRILGIVGELHPRLQQAYELPAAPVVFELLTERLLEGAAPRFQGLSRMPAVRRDYAFTVAEATPAGAILEALRAALPGFVRAVEVFDLYRGKGVELGKKSLALRIVMQDTDRTLTDSEVEAVMASVREQLNQQFKAKPRT